MKQWNQLFALAGIVTAFLLTATPAHAQAGGRGGRGGQGGGRGNFDPAQFVQRYKETLEVTNDDEWKVIEARIEKVMEARRELAALSGRGGRGGFGGFGRRGGGGGDTAGGGAGGNNNNGPAPVAEVDALQKAVEKKAPSPELKAALAKFTAARKEKQANLEKAQAELRRVLSVRQEAIASMSGLL